MTPMGSLFVVKASQNMFLKHLSLQTLMFLYHEAIEEVEFQPYELACK